MITCYSWTQVWTKSPNHIQCYVLLQINIAHLIVVVVEKTHCCWTERHVLCMLSKPTKTNLPFAQVFVTAQFIGPIFSCGWIFYVFFIHFSVLSKQNFIYLWKRNPLWAMRSSYGLQNYVCFNLETLNIVEKNNYNKSFNSLSRDIN